MSKTPHSTIRYAAKQAYKLALMRGIHSSSPCGHFCQVYSGLGYVRVHGVEKANGDFTIVEFPIAKSWANL